MRTGFCRRCNRPIGWCFTENGRQMPLDPEPDPAGNVFVSYIDGKLVGVVRSKANPTPEGVAHTPHYATCPALPRKQRASQTSDAPVALDLFHQGEPEDE